MHFCELADGSVAICGKTLTAQMNELETNTAQLAGQAAPNQLPNSSGSPSLMKAKKNQKKTPTC